jgi:hypothetical protein
MRLLSKGWKWIISFIWIEIHLHSHMTFHDLDFFQSPFDVFSLWVAAAANAQVSRGITGLLLPAHCQTHFLVACTRDEGTAVELNIEDHVSFFDVLFLMTLWTQDVFAGLFSTQLAESLAIFILEPEIECGMFLRLYDIPKWCKLNTVWYFVSYFVVKSAKYDILYFFRVIT